MKRSYIREILDAVNEETISFAGGLPNEDLFPLEQIQEATTLALQTPKALQYSQSQGIASLREKIASFYTKEFGFATTADEILITTGSQQAFEIILKVFGKDEIIVQNPSYIGALTAFKSMGLAVQGFEEIEALESLLNISNDLYVMSDYINPTGKSLTQVERETIAEIINKKGNMIIEDGAYSFLSFDGSIKKPICSNCEFGFHLGSFSKIIAPGLRVGWIRANKKSIQKILAAKESIDLHTPTLNQMIIDNFLEHNCLQEHIQKVRNDYEKRMSYMSACFKKYLPSFRFEEPKGGMFIYGEFEEDSMTLAKEALIENVAFVPASVFYSDNRVSKAARFNFTNASFEAIENGIKKLAALITQKSMPDFAISSSIWYTLFQNMQPNSPRN